MNDKWLGKFGRMKRCSWLSLQHWLWIFLHIWCLFDLVMFPFLFAVFYIKHCRNKNKLKEKGRKKIYILNQTYFSAQEKGELKLRVSRNTHQCPYTPEPSFIKRVLESILVCFSRSVSFLLGSDGGATLVPF